MPKFKVQEMHPGSRPVFVYSIVDDDIDALAAAIMAEQDRGYYMAEGNGISDSIEPSEVEKFLRKGAKVSLSRWYGMGRASITFRNTMRLAVEADDRGEADKLVMLDYDEYISEEGDGSEMPVSEEEAPSPTAVPPSAPASQIKVEKFRDLIVESGLLDEAAMSGGDVSVELESDAPLTFAFTLPTSVRHADIMEKPAQWADAFGADVGTVEFGADGQYHARYSVSEN